MNTKKEYGTILSFLLFLFCLYLFWALIIPFNQAPDEYQRFDLAKFIYQYHSLPVAGDQRLYYGPYGITYAAYPYLAYMIDAVLMIAFKGIVGVDHLYLVARFFSVICGVISVYFMYKICIRLKLNPYLKWFVTVLYALLPQYSFINSYVNLEAFSLCVGSFIAYMLIKGSQENWSYANIVSLGIGLGLCLLSYYNEYIMIPATGFVLLCSMRSKMITKGNLRKIFLMILIMLVISGWWFVRNAILYHGDILGFRTNDHLSNQLAVPSLKPSNRPTMYNQGHSILWMLLHTNWFELSYKSSIGGFGYMNVWLPDVVFNVILVILCFSVLGLLVKIFDAGRIFRNLKFKRFIVQYHFYIALCFMIVLALGLDLQYSYKTDFQPQGRYFFPGLLPTVILFGIGLHRLIPNKIQAILFSVGILSIFILNLYSIFDLLLIKYYF
jgi:hypothetical protein